MGLSFIEWVILIVLIIFFCYVIGIAILYLIDKKLTNISINIPKQDVVLKLDNNNMENFVSNYRKTYYNSAIHSNQNSNNNNNNNYIDFFEGMLPSLKDQDKGLNDIIDLNTNNKVCILNHEHRTDGSKMCSPGIMNFSDPYDMSDIDKNVFKYNYKWEKFTKQDYINWLNLHRNDSSILPYIHKKNLQKILDGQSNINIPKQNFKLNTFEYFDKIYNNNNNYVLQYNKKYKPYNPNEHEFVKVNFNNK